MDWTNVEQHAIDVLKGALGAAVAAFLLALMQYLGAHIGDITSTLAMVTGGVGGVKVHLG
ncbi:MAG: hypothetical protein ACREGR_00405 [Minisyncoccia bacterium]